MAVNSKNIDTKAVHAGEPRPRLNRAVAMPIYQSSTFESGDGEMTYDDVGYARLSNTPNHFALHQKLAALENAEAALVTSSGMAAISTSLLTVLHAGDHLLAQSVLYGGTWDLLVRDLPLLGITVDFIDASDPDSWSEKLRPNTKAIYVETMTNPLLEVGRLDEIAAFAKGHGLVSLIDNTFASPVNFRPAEHGYDLSLHSATKYLNGHTDLIAGAVIGSRELVNQVTHKLNHFGGSLDPHACFLLQRGIKTLALRVRHQSRSALSLAGLLEGHAAVSRVNYPGLESSPTHDSARKLLDGFGGVLSFELKGGADAAARLVSSLEIALNAPSLGGVETLITRPSMTSHLGLTSEERAKIGLPEGLVRVSVGIEAIEDLSQDFDNALSDHP